MTAAQHPDSAKNGITPATPEKVQAAREELDRALRDPECRARLRRKVQRESKKIEQERSERAGRNGEDLK